MSLTDLTEQTKKDWAMQMVSSAENSSLAWRKQYAYIEDIKDGRGYTAGIIGFCSGTGDMLVVVERYAKLAPGEKSLTAFLPALRKVNGTASHKGLDEPFVRAWKDAAKDPQFQKAQDAIRDEWYFTPAVTQAKADGLRALGQFIYYDALVMHGSGNDGASFGAIRKAALSKAYPPARGGDEIAYLNAFLDARKVAMKSEAAHEDTTRVDTAQRIFVQQKNLDFNAPFVWKVYGQKFQILR
ncbi:MAG: chitosanase [Armatimonadota bacterium]